MKNMKVRRIFIYVILLCALVMASLSVGGVIANISEEGKTIFYFVLGFLVGADIILLLGYEPIYKE